MGEFKVGLGRQSYQTLRASGDRMICVGELSRRMEEFISHHQIACGATTVIAFPQVLADDSTNKRLRAGMWLLFLRQVHQVCAV